MEEAEKDKDKPIMKWHNLQSSIETMNGHMMIKTLRDNILLSKANTDDTANPN